jgi:hypothetical protein
MGTDNLYRGSTDIDLNVPYGIEWSQYGTDHRPLGHGGNQKLQPIGMGGSE